MLQMYVLRLAKWELIRIIVKYSINIDIPADNNITSSAGIPTLLTYLFDLYRFLFFYCFLIFFIIFISNKHKPTILN